jgi:hypothetical protein
MIAVYLKHFEKWKHLQGHTLAVEQFAAACKERMLQGCPQIPGAEAGCALVRVLSLRYSINSYVECGKELSSEEARLYTNSVMECLQTLDRLCMLKPKRSVTEMDLCPSVSAVEREHRHFFTLLSSQTDNPPATGASRLVSFTSGEIALRELAVTLSRSCDLIKLAVRLHLQGDAVQPPQSLDQQAAYFARSAFFLERHFRKRRWKVADISAEFEALLAYSRCLFDIGDSLASAALAARFLWTFPPYLVYHNQFALAEVRLFDMVTERGYEIPHYFQRTKNVRRKPCYRYRTSFSHAFNKSPLRSHRRWELIRSAYSLHKKTIKGPLALWQYLDWLSHHTQLVLDQPRLVRAALAVCLDNGELCKAAAFLDALSPNVEEVVRFASSICRVSQLCPLLLSIGTFTYWQKSLVSAFAKLPEEERGQMSSEQLFLVHEMLTGRSVAIVRGSPQSLHAIYRDKLDGDLPDLLLRHTLVEQLSPFVESVGTLRPKSTANFLPMGRGSSIERPICISLVDVGEDRFSLGFCDASDWWRQKIISVPRFAESFNEILAWTEEWHSDNGVPWGHESPIVLLLKEILRSIHFPSSGLKWLMLSLSAHLAKVPWQDLVFRYIDHKTIVSIVPSFTWATMEFTQPSQHRNPLCLLGTEKAYSDTRDAIVRGVDSIDCAAFALGHGRWAEERFTSLDLGNRLARQTELQELAGRRVCVIHACWGGRAGARLLGDMGGLPYYGFVLGCRYFCSPVSEVLSKTATVLHRHLTDTFGPSELGLRYLNAIREDPAVALYTIYGFANEPARLPEGAIKQK